MDVYSMMVSECVCAHSCRAFEHLRRENATCRRRRERVGSEQQCVCVCVFGTQSRRWALNMNTADFTGILEQQFDMTRPCHIQMKCLNICFTLVSTDGAGLDQCGSEIPPCVQSPLSPVKFDFMRFKRKPFPPRHLLHLVIY